MTIDERIAKLVERHEALTQSVELLANDLNELRGLVTQVAEGTARLLHVAELHERRISRLEQTNS
jgi:archaellum component FlaC